MSIISRMQNKENFTDTEQKIIQYILTHPEALYHLTIKELAIETYASSASIIRVCKKLNTSGYTEFKRVFLSEARAHHFNESALQIHEGEDTFTIINKVAYTKVKALEQNMNDLDYRKINRIVDRLMKAECIDIYASGINLYAAKYFMYCLMQLGYNVSTYVSTNQRYAQAIMSNEKHFAMIICEDGENTKYIDILKTLQQKNVYCVTLTQDSFSTLSSLSQEYVHIKGINKDDDPLLSQLIYKSNLHYFLDVLFCILYSNNTKEHLDTFKEFRNIIEQYQQR